MSLEQAIAQQTAAIMANTEAVNALLAALANGNAPAAPRGRVKPQIREDRQPDVPFNPEPEPQAAEPLPAVVAQTRTIEELQKLVLEKVQANRPAVVKILKSFGAGKATQLKPEDYDAAYEKLSAIGA